MIQKSDRVRDIHSDICGLLCQETLRMQAAGTPVLKLTTGYPANLAIPCQTVSAVR